MLLQQTSLKRLHLMAAQTAGVAVLLVHHQQGPKQSFHSVNQVDVQLCLLLYVSVDHSHPFMQHIQDGCGHGVVTACLTAGLYILLR